MGITRIRFSEDVDKPLESLAKQALEDSRWTDTLNVLESIKSGNSVEESDVNAFC